MHKEALVSIIVRTCGKPDVLKNALLSIRSQTYPNIEVIIVEDGENISEHFLKSDFSDLNYVYHATGKRLGRTRAGNIGLSLATGVYLNFLDEDDILLENHVKLLVDTITDCSAQAAYAIAEEHQIKVKSLQPYSFQVKRKLVRYSYPFNRLLLCYMNLFPIQSVLFSRTLYEQYGGFDENLDVLEDWDLWLRYALHTDFVHTPTISSIYYTPYRSRRKFLREKKLQQAEEHVREKHRSYTLTLNAKQIEEDMGYILNVFNKKGLFFYLKKIQNYLLYHDR